MLELEYDTFDISKISSILLSAPDMEALLATELHVPIQLDNFTKKLYTTVKYAAKSTGILDSNRTSMNYRVRPLESFCDFQCCVSQTLSHTKPLT